MCYLAVFPAPSPYPQLILNEQAVEEGEGAAEAWRVRGERAGGTSTSTPLSRQQQQL